MPPGIYGLEKFGAYVIPIYLTSWVYGDTLIEEHYKRVYLEMFLLRTFTKMYGIGKIPIGEDLVKFLMKRCMIRLWEICDLQLVIVPTHDF